MNAYEFHPWHRFFFALLFLLCVITGCGQQEAATEAATQTPIPSSTVPPTATLSPTPSPPQRARSTPLGGTGLIAFASNRDGNFEIFLLDVEENEQLQLTNNDSENLFPEFSPAGDHIMYWSVDSLDAPTYAEIRVMTYDDEWAIGPALGWSSWTTGGDEVVLVGPSAPGNEDILYIAHNGKSTWLTNDPANDREPDCSPDGSTIAFTSYRDGQPHIYLMDIDGSNQRRLTSFDMVEIEPDWSPDGETIAFVSGNNIVSNIFLVDADGSNLRQLTDGPGFNENPTWSPDGTMIAFWSDRTGNREIFVIGFDGTGLRQITNHPAVDENPTWSPTY